MYPLEETIPVVSLYAKRITPCNAYFTNEWRYTTTQIRPLLISAKQLVTHGRVAAQTSA